MVTPKRARSEVGGGDAEKELKQISSEFALDQGMEEQSSPEVVESQESQEGSVEEGAGTREGESEGVGEPQVVASSSPVTLPATKDPLTQKIEHVLEEDLKDVYLSLSPEKQREFLVKGEEVTGKIQKMIETATFSVKKVLNLIRDWLKIIPGVNKFFLEQEAKIKTDKISNIAKGG